MDNKMTPDLKKEFGKATGKARQLMSKKVLNEVEIAELEAYFQQATVGDGNNWKLLRSKTFFLDGNKMRFSWLSLRGMPRSEAMEKYIEIVDVFAAKHCVVFPQNQSRFSSMSSVSTTSSTSTNCLEPETPSTPTPSPRSNNTTTRNNLNYSHSTGSLSSRNSNNISTESNDK